MDAFDIEKMIGAVNESQRSDDLRKADFAERPMFELIELALAALNKPDLNWLGKARGPCTEDDVRNAELVLDCELPQSVLAFYRVCNGFMPLSDEFPFHVLSLSNAVLCESLPDPLSAWVQRHQAAHPDGDQGDPLPLFPHDDVSTLISDSPICRLPLSQVDNLVCVETSTEHRRLCFSLTTVGTLPAGAIIEIERSIATAYPSIKQWLAFCAVVFQEKPQQTHRPDASAATRGD